MEKELLFVKTKTDLERCFSLMKELRPHLSIEDYFEIYNEAHASNGYEIVAIQNENKILALMGYVFCLILFAVSTFTLMIW